MNQVPKAWEELNAELREEGRRIVYVAGGVDLGKTSLCRYLVASLRVQFRVAYLDCDTGQSTIGLPGTVGCALYGGVTERYLRFVGSPSPLGHLLPLLTGAKRLLERALERKAAIVVVDSPGFIEEGVGREFQIQLIDLLRPDHLVAIQKERELEGVLAPFARHPARRIHRILPAPGVRNRSQSERHRYRDELLEEYFQGTEDRIVTLTGLGVYGKVPPVKSWEGWRGLLVAFCDAEQFVLGLGVVQDIDPSGTAIRVRAPSIDEGKISSLQVGSMKVQLTGNGADGG